MSKNCMGKVKSRKLKITERIKEILKKEKKRSAKIIGRLKVTKFRPSDQNFSRPIILADQNFSRPIILADQVLADQ